MAYILLGYNKSQTGKQFYWSYIRSYCNNREEDLALCSYEVDERSAQHFRTRRDVRMAANKLLTRKVKMGMRTIKRVMIKKTWEDSIPITV